MYVCGVRSVARLLQNVMEAQAPVFATYFIVTSFPIIITSRNLSYSIPRYMDYKLKFKIKIFNQANSSTL